MHSLGVLMFNISSVNVTQIDFLTESLSSCLFVFYLLLNKTGVLKGIREARPSLCLLSAWKCESKCILCLNACL